MSTMGAKSKMRRPKICLLASGGYDSNVLIADLARQGLAVYPLYVRFGLCWERAEIYWLKKYLAALHLPSIKSLKIFDFPYDRFYPDHWSVTGKNVPDFCSPDERVLIPGRNLILLLMAALFCHRENIGAIALATLKGNPFPDATPAFLGEMKKLLEAEWGQSFRILTPYRKFTKAQLAGRVPNLPLHLSFSCLNPHGFKPCGVCNKCAERERARKVPLLKPS